MLYACLTKSLPYQDLASFRLLRAIVLGKFTPPRALRAELPEKLEEIILRAMHTAPEERFESVHALGRELGSSRARERANKWRSYYFDDRAAGAAQGVDARDAADRSDGARIAAGTPPGNPLALAPTEPSPPVVARPPVAEKPETAEPPKPATAEGTSERRPGKATAMAPVIAAGALMLVAASAWLMLRRPSCGDSAAVVTPVAPAAPIAPAARVAPAAPIGAAAGCTS